MADSKSRKKTKTSGELKSIKTSVLSRGLSLAKLTVQAGASVASHGIATALKSQEGKNESWKKLLKNQALNLTAELGELKGSLMKAGQMLSMYGEHFLPEEANTLLKSLQQDSPALSWDAIEPHLKKYLGAEALAELEIEKTALACASMGQVHRAKIKSSGEMIVLKIQYPQVDRAIDSDLRTLRTVLNTLKLLPKELNMDLVFEEVREMLVQETNYELEAELTQKFGELLKDDTRFVVPKVYLRYSSKKVLATSFERGLRVDDPLIQNLPQERRNKLALNFLDLYFKEIFEWGVVQTDPHNGNYKIRIDPQGRDQLVLLDFGATRSYNPDFLIPYRRMVKGSLLNDRDLFTSAALDLKFIHENDQPGLKKLFEDFCFETVEPFIDHQDPRNTRGQIDGQGLYDWKDTDLPQRLSKKIFQMMRTFKVRTPPKEIIFLDRKTGGVFIFLSVLRAKVRGRDLLLKYMEKIK
jgi:predicted unusual protein kinase regulating ubiquinone biosynthesis (AarF/ABC1/UbiB family)